MNQTSRDSCKSPEEVEEGYLEIRRSYLFVSDISCNDLDKGKSKFIEFTCIHYTPGIIDLKKKNYQAYYVKKFDHDSPEDMLLWYNKLRDNTKKKSCESREAKSTLTELLLVTQGQSTSKEY